MYFASKYLGKVLLGRFYTSRTMTELLKEGIFLSCLSKLRAEKHVYF